MIQLYRHLFFFKLFPHLGCYIIWSRGFLGWASGKEPTCHFRQHERHRFNSWVGKIPWRRAGNPLQYSCLENPMDRGARWATAHGVTVRCDWAHTHHIWNEAYPFFYSITIFTNIWWACYHIPGKLLRSTVVNKNCMATTYVICVKIRMQWNAKINIFFKNLVIWFQFIFCKFLL